MYEVELKIRADHDSIRERLGARATRERSVTQTDTYYDAPHRDFAETDEAVRVRIEQEREDDPVAKLTYKGPLLDSESKTREEHETVVADEDAVRGILDGLGFEPAATVEKDRTFYALDGYTLTLDVVSGLGEFVEIETEVDTESEIPAARDRARDLLATLGVDHEETIQTSYLGLLLAK
ncbi:MAG: class IV adenylate cyclase [Halobacteriales archaeon]|nr:class IV adenylate cyclase [Halobacteriales archaeon]